MTTNNPPIAAWAPSTALAKLASRHNNAPCVLTDGPAEFNDVALIRLSDYEALKVECEKLGKELAETELRALKFIHQCNAHVELYQELRGERDHLQAEFEKLRKDAERYVPLNEAVQRAATELPEGWEIQLCVMRDSGWVDLIGPDGTEDFDTDNERLDCTVIDALEFAIDTAMEDMNHE